MARRNFGSFALIVALAACEGGSETAVTGAPGAETIACAVGGSETFADECEVQRADEDGVLYLTVRHPDGAFRRFEVLKDGRGLALADGMDQATTRYEADTAEITVGKDRYRFPVTRMDDAERP